MTISFHDVSVQYRNTKALSHVDVDIPTTPGVTGLIGPNGAGKTTLIETALGVRSISSGRIEAREVRQAYCPDTPEFEAGLTAEEIVKESLWQAGITEFDDALIARVLASVGLKEARSSRANKFSRGMKQRLGLATGLVLRPDILYLDEPTSALDPFGRQEILKIIDNASRNMRVVVSTHLLEDVGQVADDIVVMSRGEIIFTGSKSQFLSETTNHWMVICKSDQGVESLSDYLSTCGIDVSEAPESGHSISLEFDDCADLLRVIADGPLDDLIEIRRSSTKMYSAFRALLKDNENA